MIAATQLAQDVGKRPACRALGVPRASFYRRNARQSAENGAGRAIVPKPPLALEPAEMQAVLGALHSERFIAETCEKQGIVPGQLMVHADRGPSMRSKPVALLFSDLGVTKTHSRPHVSNDNPYSEAQFKTLKYCPAFPERFGSIEDARAFCRSFFSWYNEEHHHSGIALLTPAQVHHGKAEEVLRQRALVLRTAYEQHVRRFKGKVPEPMPLPAAAWINAPKKISPAREIHVDEATSLDGKIQKDDAPGFDMSDELGSGKGYDTPRSSENDSNFLSPVSHIH